VSGQPPAGTAWEISNKLFNYICALNIHSEIKNSIIDCIADHYWGSITEILGKNTYAH
jgi:hypothetical protein